jgi:rRNA maturation RNase YbeY
MSIRFASQNIDFELPQVEKVKKWVSQVVQLRGKRVGNISYLFCDDEHLLGVNQQFLNHDTYTDIITFDYVVADLISGDIMISVDRVGENAEKFGVPFEQELHRVVIHGVLHLLGQGDKSDTEAAEMRRQEEEALALWNTMFPVEQMC